jgi:hypothetical protein
LGKFEDPPEAEAEAWNDIMMGLGFGELSQFLALHPDAPWLSRNMVDVNVGLLLVN